MWLRKSWALVVLLALSISHVRADELDDTFKNPPEAAKPGVLWMWMGCNLSKEGITRDLEALKAAGFGRTTMFSLADSTTPWAGPIGNSPTPQIISWTEPWWELVRHAAGESKRLGMDFGMFNGPGYEASGGPWVTPELSMQEVCFSQTPVDGGSEQTLMLAKPTVDPHSRMQFPVFDPRTGKVEKPIIEARKTYYRDVAVLAVPAEGNVAIDQIVDLSKDLQLDGTLKWTAPAGKWIVYRFGHTTMGTIIQPAQWEATGLECDKMSQEAVEFHIKHVTTEIQKHVGDLIGTGFTHVHFDSYEAGKPTWTPKMREEFKTRRGYELTPYLLTFAKRTVENDAKTKQFQADFERTIKDLYRDIYFPTIARLLHEAKLEFLCEPYGGPWVQDEILGQVDRVMTEFWTAKGVFRPLALTDTIAALRKQGKNILEAEAFTGGPADSEWTETPEWLKPIGDAAFCAGVNRVVLHRFVQQPWDEKYKPGNTMGQWGTHFDRTQTWWEPGKAWVQYIHRCQAMLMWGKYATSPNDFAATGEGAKDIQSIHRVKDGVDVYFVANIAREPRKVTATFGVGGRAAELWDPVTTSKRSISVNGSADGKSVASIEFAPAQSFFVVFRPRAANAEASERLAFPRLSDLQAIDQPWQVQFDPTWGGPAEPVKFDTLTDWTKHATPGIKYYSGTATYRTTFDVSEKTADPVAIDLGVVHSIARVKLNGQDLGVVWCAPWRVTLPEKLLKEKNNELEIAVTNTWRNRLIGDEQEPADMEWGDGGRKAGGPIKALPDWFVKNQPRPSKGRFTFCTWNYFTKDSPLVPAGLIGPVKLVREDWSLKSN